MLSGFTRSSDGDVTGIHGNSGNADCWLVKIDSLGNIIWQKTFGGSKEEAMYGTVNQTFDGGYIFVARSQSSDGDLTFNHGGVDDAWVVKLDGNGNIEWQHSYGGSDRDEPYCIQQTSDSGYIFVGDTYSSDGDITSNHGSYDCWVVKLDKKGIIEWQKTYGGSGEDAGYYIEQTSDGEYIVAGGSSSRDGDLPANRGYWDLWVMKLNTSGSIIWNKTFGGSWDDYAYCIHETKDGGFIVSGDTRSPDGDVTGYHGNYGEHDGWVLKLSSQGDLRWQKTLGGSSLEEAYDIKETSDGGYIFTGSALSDDGDVVGHHGTVDKSDFWVVKLNFPPGDPLALGFQSTPTTFSCSKITDSVHIIFPTHGHYEIKNISFSGIDGSNFVSIVSAPISVNASDSFEVPIPILFTPNMSSGQTNYQAIANILVHGDLLNKDYVFAIPLSANVINRAMKVTAYLENPSARAGDKVYLQIGYQIEPSDIPVPLSGLDIQSVKLVLDYNTDILDLRPNEIASWFEGKLGWSVDAINTSVDETKKQLTLTLSGKTPLINTSGILGRVVFKATLTPYDSATSFIMSSCRVFNANGEELQQPCLTLNSTFDSVFTIIPQCGDSILKLILRNKEFKPFRIISAAPNPVTNGSMSLKYSAHIDGLLSIDIYDVTGNQQKHISAKQIKAGYDDLSVDLSGIPSGLYWYKFDFNGSIVTGSFVILK